MGRWGREEEERRDGDVLECEAELACTRRGGHRCSGGERGGQGCHTWQQRHELVDVAQLGRDVEDHVADRPRLLDLRKGNGQA
jgi:hypothetical protein